MFGEKRNVQYIFTGYHDSNSQKKKKKCQLCNFNL